MYILYATNININVDNGPSVNELEFVNSISKNHNKIIIISNLDPIKLVDKNTISYTLKIKSTIYNRIYNEIILFVKLLEMHRKYNIEHFVFRYSLYPFGILSFILCKKNIKYSIKTAGDGQYLLLNKRLLYRLHKLINYYINRILYSKSHIIDVVSIKHKNSLKVTYKLKDDKVKVIDNAVNIDKFIPKRKTNKLFTIGYTGNLPYTRGGKEIIDIVYKLLSIYGTEISGIILGDSGDKQRLIEYANELGVSRNIDIVGMVPYSIIEKYVQKLDIGVSLLDNIQRGASEQKVRQYLSCGIPALVTPGSNDFVVENEIGWIVEKIDHESMCNIILSYKNSNSLFKHEMNLRCRKYAVNYLSTYKQQKDRLLHWKR